MDWYAPRMRRWKRESRPSFDPPDLEAARYTSTPLPLLTSL